MFQPVIPLTGNTGWKFLEATYDRQLESYTESAQVRLDQDYLAEKFSKPVAVEDFLKDSRLLRISLTSFDLGGEEWKRGFINKVLTEVADPESTFLTRLNNPNYTAFANAMKPVDGKITLAPAAISAISADFATQSFEAAVGEVDDNMRISLNFKSDIDGIIGNGSSDTAVLYRILANVPVRTLLEGALSIPSQVTNLTIERQADIFKERLQSVFGINKMSELALPEIVDKAIQRFHLMESIKEGAANYSPASAALRLLSNGLGSQGSQNLFLSLL